MPSVLLCATAAAIVTWPAGVDASVLVGPAAQAAHVRLASPTPCTTSHCRFPLQVNPALLSTGAFPCPAIQGAKAHITITNRFATGAPNDVMRLTATGLPANTGFDMFLVQSSPLDANFSGFGFGWYQSDVQSDDEGDAKVKVQGIFDKETFIENPSNPFMPIHTFDVGFWFNSPAEEKTVCENATTPPTTPFNGEQDAGLLAMITKGEPLQLVQ
jgi:hypothetical protein